MGLNWIKNYSYIELIFAWSNECNIFTNTNFRIHFSIILARKGNFTVKHSPVDIRRSARSLAFIALRNSASKGFMVRVSWWYIIGMRKSAICTTDWSGSSNFSDKCLIWGSIPVSLENVVTTSNTASSSVTKHKSWKYFAFTRLLTFKAKSTVHSYIRL